MLIATAAAEVANFSDQVAECACGTRGNQAREGGGGGNMQQSMIRLSEAAATAAATQPLQLSVDHQGRW